jgi:methylated-DNA-[protein]-cysteine S-methyltransferase
MPATLGYACFATAIGECALAWSDAGLTGVWLPDERPGGLRRKLARRLGAAREHAPPAAAAAAIAAIVRLLGGARVDLGDVALDLDGIDAFHRAVYEVARTIAPGRLLSYGAIARRLGGDATARAVGQALGANRFPIVVPCHRVVATGGELGGFSAPGGIALKRRLLTLEDARFDGPPDLFDTSTTDAADALLEREPGVGR